MPAIRPTPTRVLVACSGLDHAHRGFESFARECFEALRDEPELEITLVKGSGPAGPDERSIPTLTRNAKLARMLAGVWGREPFRVEQLAFGVSLLPLVARERPDVVYFSEWHTGLVLGAYRRASRRTVRLVLCNGAMAVAGFGHLDRVQQLTPAALEAALASGDDPSRHVSLPLGFTLGQAPLPSAGEGFALRASLGLPPGRKVILSVAALNRHHKRMDYLIDEISRLPTPRPFLLLLGEEEAETAGIRALAAQRLGHDGHSIRTVARTEVASFYRASDVFVLASLGEGLPRALIEALGWGLPCLAHDYPVTRFVLGGHGYLGDLSAAGELAHLLDKVIASHVASEDAEQRRRFAYENFSWDRLRSRYVKLLRGETLDSAGGELRFGEESAAREPDRASIH